MPIIKKDIGPMNPSIPQVAQTYQNDPRYALAQAMITNGASGAPTGSGSPWESLARVAQALGGAYTEKKLGEHYRDEQEKFKRDAQQKSEGTIQRLFALAGRTDPLASPTPEPVPGQGGGLRAHIANAIQGSTPGQIAVPSGMPGTQPPPPMPALDFSGRGGAVRSPPNDPMAAPGPGGGLGAAPPQGAPSPAMAALLMPGQPQAPAVPKPDESMKLAIARAMMGSDNNYSFSQGLQDLPAGLDEDAHNRAVMQERQFQTGMEGYRDNLGDRREARQAARGDIYNEREGKRALDRTLTVQHDSQGFQHNENELQRQYGASQADIDRAKGYYEFYVQQYGHAPPGGEAGALEVVTGKSSGKGTVALEGNNPGGINDGDFAKKQPGYKGANGRFASFATLQDGVNAQSALLRSYVQRGFDTPLKIAERWAPKGDGNDPATYAANIAKQMGIGVNDRIGMGAISKFQAAQATQENHNYNPEVHSYSVNAPQEETMVSRWGGKSKDQHTSFGGGNTRLRKDVSTDLTSRRDLYQNLRDFHDRWKDNYSIGGPETYANGVNAMQGSKFGQMVAGSNPDRVRYWQDFQTFVNDVRHSKFGGALTPGEKAEFDKEVIHVNSDPRIVQAFLKKWLTRAQQNLDKSAKSYGAQGYSSEGITQLIGPDIVGRLDDYGYNGGKSPTSKPDGLPAPVVGQSIPGYPGKYAMQNGKLVRVE